jgi:Holliday junction DNA helicase RuvB
MSRQNNNAVVTERETGFLDQTLRPSRWDEYIGQKNIKDNLHILLTAAKEREHPPEHILFYGPPGLGMTTLAHLIAKETNAQMKVTSGPAILKVGDLASVLTNLSAGDILFIDEIHRLNKAIEEVLYPAMESGKLDIIIGKGPSARTIQLDLPPFTLIAATTRIAMISAPLRSRFSGGVFKLEFYTNDEISEIVKRSSKILDIHILPEAVHEIAIRSRFTPRTANYHQKFEWWDKYFKLRDFFSDVQYVFASTIHKLQGSTYETVYFDLLSLLNNRNISKDSMFRLVYVAITRAKSKVKILY